MEIWKDVEGYEGLYQVSNLGRVKSFQIYEEGKILDFDINRSGYCMAHLWRNKKSKWFSVHRLVANAFIPNPNNYPCVNHIDENKQNNCVDNLEWCTIEYNNAYGTRTKRPVPVCQYDTNGNFIKEYPSATHAMRETGIVQSNIRQCCIGKNPNGTIRYTAGGFIWRYK